MFNQEDRVVDLGVLRDQYGMAWLRFNRAQIAYYESVVTKGWMRDYSHSADNHLPVHASRDAIEVWSHAYQAFREAQTTWMGNRPTFKPWIFNRPETKEQLRRAYFSASLVIEEYRRWLYVA